jgi:4-hydroxy-4-methyl-2-oxoglutarate aldolase
MERHTLHGVVNVDIERPDAALIEGFRRHEVAKVGDAMAGHGIAHSEIKPIAPGMKVCGPAVTILTRPGDALFVQKAADVAQAGDVILCDAGGGKEAAVIGERIGFYMQQRGIVGFVVDGAVRDKPGLVELGFATFARAVTPRIYGSVGPGAINVLVQCGGVPVHPGDIVIGDDDGLVIVPRADAARVLHLADEHLAGELQRLERMRNGETLTEIFGVDAKIARWQEH